MNKLDTPVLLGAAGPTPDPSTMYIGQPDIPVGMTVAEYRRSRPSAMRLRRRVLRWRG